MLGCCFKNSADTKLLMQNVCFIRVSPTFYFGDFFGGISGFEVFQRHCVPFPWEEHVEQWCPLEALMSEFWKLQLL